MVDFSECGGSLKKSVIEAINGDSGVSGDLCVDILTGQKNKHLVVTVINPVTLKV